MIAKNTKDKDKSVGEIISEINIIRDQLKHPNIVRYYRTFTVGEYMCTCMLASYDSFEKNRISSKRIV